MAFGTWLDIEGAFECGGKWLWNLGFIVWKS